MSSEKFPAYVAKMVNRSALHLHTIQWACDPKSIPDGEPLYTAAALTEAVEKAVSQQWQPIGTAPKDTVFKDGNHDYGPTILVSEWGEPFRARWWSHSDGSSNFIQDGGRACFPTHWMPLPLSPKKEGK